MKTILQILMVVLLGYLFWAYGLPWIQREVGRDRPPLSNPARGRGGECVQLAARAAERLHDDILDRPHALEDGATRNATAEEVENAIQQARFACACKLQSCIAAREALSSLTSIFVAARDDVRSSQSVPLEYGRSYEQANEKLWRAYELARDDK
jgi:hypothetical protein